MQLPCCLFAQIHFPNKFWAADVSIDQFWLETMFLATVYKSRHGNKTEFLKQTLQKLKINTIHYLN